MNPNQQTPQNNNQSPENNNNNIFQVQPPKPPTPQEKKRTALWITIGLIVGFAILLAGIFFALFLWANSAANTYRSQTSQHLTTLANEVEGIDIRSILNRRDTTELQQNVEEFAGNRPRLEAVILAESTSARYRSTEDLQVRVDEYYEKTVQFVDNLPNLLEFSNAIEKADNDLAVLMEERPPETPGVARTLAGSIDDIAIKLEETEVPEALAALRDELADGYRRLAEGYRDLAAAFEGPDISVAQANRRIDAARRSIKELNETDLTEEVQQYRDNLVREAETLLSQL